MKRMATIATLLLALLLAAVPACAEYTRYGTMMVDNCEEWVSLRDAPDRSGARLARVPLFALVTDAVWESDFGDYIYCDYDGISGYILSKYLVPWADPEPEGWVRCESGLGFAFEYDDALLYVDESAGDGLTLCAADDAAASLWIITADGLDVPLDEFLEEYARSNADYGEDHTDAGAKMRWLRMRDGDDMQVYYTVEGGNGGVAAAALCPLGDAESWIALFDAVMRSIDFSDGAPVRADWAEPTPAALVVDADGEYVTIMSDEPLTEVALLALSFSGGEDFFDTEVLFERDAITEDAPFVVRIAFPGDIPSYGIRFTDPDGETRRFAIAMSGRDGSLVMSEF